MRQVSGRLFRRGGFRRCAVLPQALEAANRLIQMGERLVGTACLLKKGDSRPCHVVGGLIAKLRETRLWTPQEVP